MIMASRAHAALGSRNRRLRGTGNRSLRWSDGGSRRKCRIVQVAVGSGCGSREMLIDTVLALELF